jgi:hypothetical protein
MGRFFGLIFFGMALLVVPFGILMAVGHAAQAPVIDSREPLQLNSDMPVTASLAEQPMDYDGLTCGDAALMPKDATQLYADMTDEEDPGMACWQVNTLPNLPQPILDRMKDTLP